MENLRQKPELLAPAGDWECAGAAAANGADAVYFGMPAFNARMRATNFTAEELPKLMDFLHERGMRGYVTFNVLIFTDELTAAQEQLILLQKSGVDAILVQDLGLAALAREVVPDLEVHASTQMTLTSPEGVAFAHRLGIRRVVLARENSLREIEKFRESPTYLPMETFVHGALCVAYSGQCLTSEALGQRSANRGECAQACRLPYELYVDGQKKDLGDKKYLLSPQDLAAVEEIPELIRLGVRSFKIEGRLKTPEYVAAICQVYRKAIDLALAQERPRQLVTPEDRYKMEMVFSRGLFSGWMHGVNHQQLVHAHFGKKRGAFVGYVRGVGNDYVEVAPQVAVRPGDGLVFDDGQDTENEQGGRVYEIRGERLYFRSGKIDFKRIHNGDRVWKTDDPQLEKQLRRTFEGELPRPRKKLDWVVSGAAGRRMSVVAHCEGIRANAHSAMPLEPALKQPLTAERLREQFGRLGDTPFALGDLKNELEGEVILPASELNRLRRELTHALKVKMERGSSVNTRRDGVRVLEKKLAEIGGLRTARAGAKTQLNVLCRDLGQLEAALECGARTLYADFEDLRRYKDAVDRVRANGNATILLATPRIQKAGERGFFQLIESYKPDGVLVRNLGGISYFRNREFELVGDFSLNVANPLTAQLLRDEGLNRLTVSYDLNAEQVKGLLEAAPPEWFEITLHQHMPMFHMEHCVFAAFLSNGTDHTNCGRPCDRHVVELKDRVGMRHPLKADVGCRNTLFHGQAQTGAAYLRDFLDAGARCFRVELLNESPAKTRAIIHAYEQLLAGRIDTADLMQKIKAQNKLGVTQGPLAISKKPGVKTL
jgi:putative protease